MYKFLYGLQSNTHHKYKFVEGLIFQRSDPLGRKFEFSFERFPFWFRLVSPVVKIALVAGGIGICGYYDHSLNKMRKWFVG